MSRIQRVLRGLFSSYLLLVATGVYSLASVPLALHYLDKSHFGLWILMGTLSNYIALIDLGMMNAGCRLFIDHKDERDGGDYGSLIQSCVLVSGAQALIVIAVALFSGEPLARLLHIPTELDHEFIQLYKIQCSIIALSCLTRIFMLLLVSHQRIDLVNYAGLISLLVNFFAQWGFFHAGAGVLSLSYGGLVAAFCVVPLQMKCCLMQGVFPSSGSWGRASWRHFRELFLLGKDLFLVSLGSQMIMASQSIIITRFIGLEAAATWGVGLRVFTLLNQAVGRVTDITEPVFAEMITRNEWSRLKDRYASLAIFSFSLAGWVAFSFANCNNLFVTLWTHGKIHWSVECDLLLAIWMIVLSVTGRHSKFLAVTKEIGFMRYIYFLEGMVFLLSSSLVITRWGLPGLILCSILCGILFSGLYTIWRVSRYFGFSMKEVGLEWLRPMTTMLLWFLPCIITVWLLCIALPPFPRLIINLFVDGAVGAALFLRFGIPSTLHADIMNRVPAWGAPILHRILPTHH